MFPPVLMFVAGAPDPGLSHPIYLGFWGRLGAGALPSSMWASSGLTQPEEVPGGWHLPGEMLRSVEIVEREAARLHLQLRVIDVNRPGTDRELMERHVGPEDLLPLLVRSDNGRLDGFDAISPSSVRRFLSRH